MADNIISKYYTKNDGSQIGNDVQLINNVYQNEKIINKNSGEKFVKSSNYRNVFDKVDEKISKIDDANANGVCSCKNASGVEVDTFKCHVPVSNSAPTLKWGESNTIGTVDGKPLTVILPPNPNSDTKYSAGRGLNLNGNFFNINIPNYNVSDGTNPDETFIMTLDIAQNACHPSGYTIGRLLEMIKNSGGPTPPPGPTTRYFYFNQSLRVGDVVAGSNLYSANNHNSSTASGTWKLLWKEYIGVQPNTQGITSEFNYYGKFENVG